MIRLVKATLVGSILGNVLLVLGAAMVWGGVRGGRRRGRQRFNRNAARGHAVDITVPSDVTAELVAA